jgi:hypothetical protein
MNRPLASEDGITVFRTSSAVPWTLAGTKGVGEDCR